MESGEVRTEPFYSIYEKTFTPEMKQSWRELTARLIEEFGLRPHPVQPKADFWQEVGRDPLDIMLDDRGPQITFGVANGRDVSDEYLPNINHRIPLTHGRRDLRVPIARRATELFETAQLPVTPRLGGNYSIDFAIAGISKATAIKSVLSNPDVLATIGLAPEDIQNPDHLEVWGDKFSVHDGGTDRHISEALPPEVRAIDFREEDPDELPEGYNIVIWDGQRHLHDGLLEYLQSRHKNQTLL